MPRAMWRLMLAAAAVVATVGVRAEIIDRILAVVDGEVITLSDVTAALRFGFVQPEAGSDPIGSALDQIIERELVLREANRYGPPEPAAEAIDGAVATLRTRFDDAAEFAAALVQAGLTEDQFRRRIRDDLRIRSYVDQRFAAASQTADQERRMTAVRDWIAELRRRAEVTVLYEPKPATGF